MSHTHLINTRSIQHFDILVSSFEQDPDLLCRKASIIPSTLKDVEGMIPYSNAAILLQMAAEQCRQPDFGLRLADAQPALNLGALGLLLKCCGTLGEGLDYVVRFYHIQSQAVSITLHTTGACAYLLREDLWLGKAPTFQYNSLTFAHFLKAMRFSLGKDWKPAYVTFTHNTPANHKDYQRYFECPVEFDQPASTFGFPAADLNRALASNNPELRDDLERKVAQQGHISKVDILRNTEHLVRQLLHSENCTQENIAQLFGIHPKKLQRELKQAGSSFRTIRSEMRLCVAEHYLKDSEVPLTAIAEMLGFSELSAFSRAFSKKHRLSPSDWRKQQNQ